MVAAIRINDQAPITFARDPLGRISAERLSDQLSRTYGYDEEGRLVSQRVTSALHSIERGYQYDPAGHLIAHSDSNKGNWRFVYDPMGRIIESIDPLHQVRRHTYDPAGDIVSHLPNTQKGLRAATHQGRTYRYDAAGNLTEREQKNQLTRFEWDEQNRLRTVCTPEDTVVRMAYDAIGRRQRKSVNGERTFFAWDGDALLSEWQDDQPAREYVYYPGTFEPLALIDSDGQLYYYHNELNGLPAELTNLNGEPVWSATYDALGRIDQILVDDIPQPLRMQGQYWDEEIGLSYNRHRYFDPQICSFISQDPIGFAGGDNAYAYAPNVWGWIDPIGLACKKSNPETTALQKYYPNNEGFIESPQRKFLPGERIDRYGGSDYSRFFSPEGTPKGARALPPGTANQPLRTFEIVKPFEVESGTVAPAFGELGLGTQFRTPVRMGTLLDRGIISEIK